MSIYGSCQESLDSVMNRIVSQIETYNGSTLPFYCIVTLW